MSDTSTHGKRGDASVGGRPQNLNFGLGGHVQQLEVDGRLITLIVLVVLCSYSLLHLLVSPLQSVLPFLTTPTPPSYHGYTSPFSFDMDKAVNPDWMSRIPENTNLASLSIPGTHDTLTYDLVKDRVFQCQNHDLKRQLRAGLRYFDVRGRLVVNETTNPVIGIFHANVFTGYTFQDVLLTMFEFLEENPSEGIVMRIKQEGRPVRVDPHGNVVGDEPDQLYRPYNITFQEAFDYYRLENPLTAKGSMTHLLLPWPPSGPTPAPAPAPALPTMAQLRSRILILQEFPSPSPESSYGIPWKSPHVRLEDLWIIQDPAHLDEKWNAIQTSLQEAAASPADADVLFLSHLSASVGVLPIEAATGPLGDRGVVNGTVVVGMNDRTGKWLEEGERVGGKTGIVMADFPGQRLVGAILKRNEWLMNE